MKRKYIFAPEVVDIQIITKMDGNQLRELRKKFNLTQYELADLIEVKQETVARWESRNTISNIYQKVLQNFFESFEKKTKKF